MFWSPLIVMVLDFEWRILSLANRSTSKLNHLSRDSVQLKSFIQVPPLRLTVQMKFLEETEVTNQPQGPFSRADMLLSSTSTVYIPLGFRCRYSGLAWTLE